MRRSIGSLFLMLALACLAARAESAAPLRREPPLTSPADAIVLANQDRLNFPPEDQCFLRYLWAIKPSARLTAAWKLHENLLSRYSEMLQPAKVTPWLWRIDIRDPIWNPGTLENAVEVDVFFHERVRLDKDTIFKRYWPGGKDKDGKFFKKSYYDQLVKAGEDAFLGASWLPAKELNELRAALFTEVPVLSAEWLFVQSCRQLSLRRSDKEGLGYYDFLQIHNRKDYFRLIALDERLAEDFGREFRAVAERSGISPQNRQLGRYGATDGGAWFTLDTTVQKDRGIALRNLKPGQFLHNAEEWYSPLPNELPATGLFNDKGDIQAVAPGDTIGLHDTSPLNESVEKSLHVNLACIRCHERQVLKPFSDDVRKRHAAGGYAFLGSASKKGDLLLRRLYLSDIYKYLARDQLRYIDAFRLATVTDDYPLGLSTEQACRFYARTFHAYADDDVTLDVAARELGVTTVVFVNALRNAARPPKLGRVSLLSDTPLTGFLEKKPLPLTRLTWEDSYALSQKILAQDRIRGVKP